ncbi:putative endonuclease [Geobacillus phage vB_GthS_NIIg9.7]|nr:putative endonuclease [Geobacillus phage vB_GthS_NIIg9.7]
MLDYWIRLHLKGWDELDERVKQEIEKMLLIRKGYYITSALNCESPIEQLLLLHLLGLREHNHFKDFDSDAYVMILPQKEVEYEGNKYRIDIAIEIKFMNKTHLFAIECDGHEFHEKTKEQALRDKKRQRDLTALGYHVIRFTGSEIWHKPSKAAHEVIKLIDKITGYDDLLQKVIEEDLANM